MAEREAMQHSEKIAGALQRAVSSLAEGENGEVAAIALVKQAANALKEIASLGKPYEELQKRVESCFYELEEAGYELSSLLESTQFNPERAEYIDERLDLIRRLERKYGRDAEEIITLQEDLQEEYDRYASMDEEVAAMGREHKRLLADYRAKAKRLSESRHALSQVFAANMMKQLADLGMGKAVFAVRFEDKTNAKPQMPQPYGDDTVEFVMSANPGEPLKSISKTASGGELSRLMLAIKSLEAEHAGVGCMVFDEIDTGISGRIAQVVAEKMAGIAWNRQVICVTHLPQIAAMAKQEYLVQKSV